VSWNDGAVIERPFFDEYERLYPPWGPWIRQQRPMRRVTGLYLYDIYPDIHDDTLPRTFIYRCSELPPVIFHGYIGGGWANSPDIRLYMVWHPPSDQELKDGLSPEAAFWRSSVPGQARSLTDNVHASRMLWFLLIHLDLARPRAESRRQTPIDYERFSAVIGELAPLTPDVAPPWIEPDSDADRPTKSGVRWPRRGVGSSTRLPGPPRPWRATPRLLAERGRPDCMDGYEQMVVTLLGQPEQSLAWIPESEFRIMFST
jgi:hypothetical protein